jgi:hypothetical protein
VKIIITVCAILSAVLVAHAEKMPPLRVENLSGDSLVVPARTATAPSLFVIGFTKKSRAQTSQWTQRLEREDPHGEPPYQVAILDDVPRFLRGLVLHAIRSGIPERLHKRFLIVYDNADVWKRLARFVIPDDAYVLVIGAGGKLVWRTEGGLTEERFKALLEAIAAARLQPSLP